MIPGRKEKSLGVSKQTRQYDLPLTKSSGTAFLVLLMVLMSFLGLLALAASFAMGTMTERWSTGLENNMTVEIPAEGPDGQIMAAVAVKALAHEIAQALEGNAAVRRVHVLSDEEIHDLVKPWLGEDLVLDEVPLPGLVALELKNSKPALLEDIRTQIKDIAPMARLDTHEKWLQDVLRFTGALQFAASLLTIVIGATAVIAVAGAVRSRLSEHKEEVELLHLMGATDNYISKQFQRHSFLLTLYGSLAGVVVGSLILKLIGWISGEVNANLLPEFKLSFFQLATMAVLPLFMSGIAIITARQTVMNVLKKLP